MAYITTEKTKEIRDKLKEAFPRKDGWKISVRNEHHTSVRISIMEAPIEFSDEPIEHSPVNHYYIDDHGWKNPEVLKYIRNVANEGNFDHSDPMTDYFHVGWYFSLEIGKWDKPFKVNNPKNLK